VYALGLSLKMQKKHTPAAWLQIHVSAQILAHALHAIIGAVRAEESSKYMMSKLTAAVITPTLTPGIV